MAKISRPKMSGVVTRTRVVTLLDVARNQPIVWVSAPAGYGKTTLVTSYLDERNLPCLWYQFDEGDADISTFFYYMGLAAKRVSRGKRISLPLLTPEYLQGIATFSRRYFESLYSRLAQRFVLVFDNYHNVPVDSILHDIMREGLSSVPDGTNIIIISRGEPPPAFVSLRACNRMSFIGWREIKFNLDETNSLIQKHNHHAFPDEALTNLYNRTDGWAAGIVLMLERMKTDENDPAVLYNLSQEEVFHYFAGELFEKAGKETQDFLLTSAFLPSMTAEEAQELTGNNTSATILAALNRNHFFTERHLTARPVYQYHPLFREFLLVRAENTLPAKQMLELQRGAAALLERSARAEPAAELMCKTGDWEGLSRLINTWAQAFIAQGRTQTLEGWLRSFPEEFLDNNPWLAYWFAACRLPFSPAESQRHFEHSFELFKTVEDPVGLFLSWSGVMEAILLGWGEFVQADRWIEMLEELLRKHPQPPSSEIEARLATSMLFALTLRQPHHPDIGIWVERARNVAQRSTNIRLKSYIYVYLELYYLWVGDHVGAEIIITDVRESASSPDAPPLAHILGKIIEAVYQVRIGGHDTCRKAVLEGLQIAATTGVVIWNSQLFSQGAINALSEGNLIEAGEYLQKMAPVFLASRRIDACMYHYNTAWASLLRQDMSDASQHVDAALRFALEAGTPFHEAISRIALAQVLHEQGVKHEAMCNLSQAHRIAVRMNSRILEFMCLLSRAQFAVDRDDEAEVLEHLAKAMALGRKEGYTNFYWWRAEIMSRLCAKALDAGIEVVYVRDLIRKRKLMPAPSFPVSEQWPWPLKIYTLGRFALVKEDKRINFSGKVQQKPLAMLKALIAMGGREVSEERLSDHLWPDAEGSVIRSAFNTTLHRLRRLLDNDRAVLMSDGKITLNPSYCWVDAWAFERCAGQFEALSKDEPTGKDPLLFLNAAEKALSIYQGNFLAGDTGQPWAISCRERLRSKYLHLINMLGRYWEDKGEWSKAVDCYRKGLHTDDLVEEFYQCLMVCYRHLGKRAEALALYNRCRATLAAVLGVAPSSKTKALFEKIEQQ
ncbi:MAG: transcriptional activator domain-containing [Geobacteraceae bacterium]|nr:MAG: transcriptional activator domain-containing [Geobacteraceae bacterium]